MNICGKKSSKLNGYCKFSDWAKINLEKFALGPKDDYQKLCKGSLPIYTGPSYLIVIVLLIGFAISMLFSIKFYRKNQDLITGMRLMDNSNGNNIQNKNNQGENCENSNDSSEPVLKSG